MQNLPLEISLLKMAAKKKKHKEWAGPKVALLLFPTRVLSQFEEKDDDVLVQQLITSRLGAILEADPVNDDQGSEEYHHALAISARSIGTMYNQPYARKRKFSKCKPSTLRPKIARQCNNRLANSLASQTHMTTPTLRAKKVGSHSPLTPGCDAYAACAVNVVNLWYIYVLGRPPMHVSTVVKKM